VLRGWVKILQEEKASRDLQGLAVCFQYDTDNVSYQGYCGKLGKCPRCNAPAWIIVAKPSSSIHRDSMSCCFVTVANTFEVASYLRWCSKNV